MTENKTYGFEFTDLHLKRSEIETVLGYKDEDDKVLVSDLIDEILNEASGITNIRAQWSIFNDVRFLPETRSVDINKINFGIDNYLIGLLFISYRIY